MSHFLKMWTHGGSKSFCSKGLSCVILMAHFDGAHILLEFPHTPFLDSFSERRQRVGLIDDGVGIIHQAYALIAVARRSPQYLPCRNDS